MNPISMGIDISKWQGNFDMGRAKNEGVKFVIIKGGGGDHGLYKDTKFERNYSLADSLNIPIGVYWYSRALNISQAKKEAEYFYKDILIDKKFELPIYIDVEDAAQLSVGKRLLTDIIKAWCSYLEHKGYWVGIYSSTYFFNTAMYDEELTKYSHWVAQWSKECTYKRTQCLGMWQYGGETNKLRSNKIAGVVCDQNYMYVDYPALIKNSNCNGFGKNSSLDNNRNAIKNIDDIAKEVIFGKWGVGSERKKKLLEAGYDYSTVQKRVNELLKE